MVIMLCMLWPLGPCVERVIALVAEARDVLHGRHLRLVAAGGDGTVAWLLTTARQLSLNPPPPVGVIPLGTGQALCAPCLKLTLMELLLQQVHVLWSVRLFR
jgi:diacylglycerol kinase family enzyme